MINDFIDYFKQNQHQNSFKFGPFFNKKFGNKTPEKMKLSFDRDLENTKQTILVNLYKNRSFSSLESLSSCVVAKLVRLFEIKEWNPRNEAHLAYLVHLSKFEICKDDFELHFGNFDSICLIDYQNSDYDLQNFFQKIKRNKIILDAISTIVYDFTNENLDQKEDLKSIKLNFFRTNVPLVNGYAGFDSVYICSNRLDDLRTTICFTDRISKDQEIKIIRLYFIRLILHEITHVIIRIKKKDMNASSPFIENRNKIKYQNEKWLEAGIFAEREIFGAKIDFHLSLIKPGFNIDYLLKFYSDLIENEIKTRFNLEESGVFVYNGPPGVMGVDFGAKLNFTPIE